MTKKITLACKDCKNKNYKINKTIDERLTIKKFCKKCNIHTFHQEEK